MRRYKESEEILPTVDNTRYLDIQEQENIVHLLELRQLRQSSLWRGTFCALTGAFSFFFALSAYWQASSPWETKYHSYFMEDVNAVTIVITDVCTSVVYACTAWNIVRERSSHHFSLWVTFVAGCGLAIFWLFQMQRLSKMHWDVFWLPFGPSCCAAMCLYVDHLMLETKEELKKLRASMYHFKKN